MVSKNSFKEEKYYSIFATRLRDLMDKKGITQNELALKLGKTRQAISQYRSGIIDPSLETLLDISNALDTSIDYLLGKTNDSTPTCSAVDDLGLSEYVISYLKYCNESEDKRQSDYLTIINALFETLEFKNMLDNIRKYVALQYATSIYNAMYYSIFPNGDSDIEALHVYNSENPDNRDSRYDDFVDSILCIAGDKRYPELIYEYIKCKLVPNISSPVKELDLSDIYEYNITKIFSKILSKLTDISTNCLGEQLYGNNRENLQQKR